MKTPTMLGVLSVPTKMAKTVEQVPQGKPYKEPTPQQMKVDAAHRAHRGVVEDWVAGKVSTQKVNQSHTRLKKVVKGHV
jgi:hypothetical protein